MLLVSEQVAIIDVSLNASANLGRSLWYSFRGINSLVRSGQCFQVLLNNLLARQNMSKHQLK